MNAYIQVFEWKLSGITAFKLLRNELTQGRNASLYFPAFRNREGDSGPGSGPWELPGCGCEMIIPNSHFSILFTWCHESLCQNPHPRVLWISHDLLVK